MSDPKHEELVSRIVELEDELAARESDLKRFREELARANQRLEGLIRTLDQEIKLAHAIQKALVPTEFPHITGFEFSTKFVPSPLAGGDYFDIFEHEDHFRFGVIVSSSSGHTMSALMLSILLRMTGQLEARRGSEPHQVIHDMREQMKPHLTSEDSADIFYALVDRRSYDLRFVRVGEIVALYQNALTGEVSALTPTCPVLNLNFLPPTASQTLQLNPRDRVVVCTRGVIEAKNAQGEAYGMERVTHSFITGPKRGVHELRNHILLEVDRFAPESEARRDRTVVVLEVKDKVIKLAKG